MAFQSLLLRRVTRADVHAEPFPYLVRQQIVDPSLFAQLDAEFPDVMAYAHSSNKVNRHSILFDTPEAGQIFARSSVWREFKDQLLSQRFLSEVLALFHDELKRVYPQMAGNPRLVHDTDKEWLRSLYRMTRKFRESVYIQANFNMSGDGYAIGPHYDNPKKLAAGLMYFREQDDTRSEGGDFLVLRKKNPDSPRVFDRMKDTVEDPELEIAARLPYGSNTFCFMFNGHNSLHAATDYRGHGRFRRFIYFDIGTFYRLF